MVMWTEFFWLRDKVQWRASLNMIVNLKYDKETGKFLNLRSLEFLAAVWLKIQVFWNFTPCRVVNSHGHFDDRIPFIFQFMPTKKTPLGSFTCRSARLNISEGLYLQFLDYLKNYHFLNKYIAAWSCYLVAVMKSKALLESSHAVFVNY